MIHFNKESHTPNRTYKINGESFENAREFLATNRSRTKVRENWNDSKMEKYDFVKVHSYKEAEDLLFNGYTEALEEFKDVVKMVGNDKKKVTFYNDIVGFQPIVPNAIIGIPKAMVNTRISYKKSPIIDIYYDSSFSGSTDSSNYIKAGKKLIEAILTLEQNGYRINLYNCQIFCGQSDDTNIDMRVLKIKDSNRPLNINRMTFSIAHPAMSRGFDFEWMSKVPGGTNRNGYGKVFSNEFSKELRDKIIYDTLGKNARLLTSAMILNENVDNILKMIKKE